jgi:hypothetical protein
MGSPLKDWDCGIPGRNHTFKVIHESWAEIVSRCTRCGYEDGAHL